MCPAPSPNGDAHRLVRSSPPTTRLILPPLQQPLGDLVLLDDVDVGTPTGERIAVDGVEQRLRDGLEQLIRALRSGNQSSVGRKRNHVLAETT